MTSVTASSITTKRRPRWVCCKRQRLWGNTDFKQCLVFHSLSKRSNLPGLRSGFVAGDTELIQEFRRYRTYHGCAMPLHHQRASIAAWSDEQHVVENRQLYRAKFDSVTQRLSPVLPVSIPPAGFYLWPKTPMRRYRFCARIVSADQRRRTSRQFLRARIQRREPRRRSRTHGPGGHTQRNSGGGGANCDVAVARLVPMSRNLPKQARVDFIDQRLNELYPEPPVPLDHSNPYTLLVAVLLSAQCTR